MVFFFFQAEDGIRDLVRSRGLGDVYKRQSLSTVKVTTVACTSAIGAGSMSSRAWPLNETRAGGRCRAPLELSLIHI